MQPPAAIRSVIVTPEFSVLVVLAFAAFVCIAFHRVCHDDRLFSLPQLAIIVLRPSFFRDIRL